MEKIEKDVKAKRTLFILSAMIIVLSTIAFINRVDYGKLDLLELFSMSCDILGIYILSLFMFRTLFVSSNVFANKSMVFANFIFFVLVLLFDDMIGYATEGITIHIFTYINMISSSLEYFLNILVIYLFIRYIETQWWAKKNIKYLRKAIFIYMLLEFFTLIANYFLNFGFTVNENGEFISYNLPILLIVLNEFMLFLSIFFIDKKKITVFETTVVFIYILFPIFCIILKYIETSISFVSFGVVVASTMIYVQLHLRQEMGLLNKQQQLQNEKVQLSLSQIKPHFIYNVLNSISSLCLINPNKAMEVTTNFSKYLRGNLDNLGSSKLVSIKKELEHTKCYTDLEQIRFGDRLKVEYKIDDELNFNLPALTIQPIVENAIKHGVCERIEGGKVTIKVYSDSDNYFISIVDNGVGFDIKEVKDDGKTHYGTKLVKDRIQNLTNGLVEVYSKKDKGTQVTISIPKTDFTSEYFGGGGIISYEDLLS